MLPPTVNGHALVLHDNYPNIAEAKYPAIYKSAMAEMEKCTRIDECQDWADKAEAMASYAKQAKNTKLHAMADRIQARAIKRCGDLLMEYKPSKGGRPNEKLGSAPDQVSRSSAAKEAGLSRRQKQTALRVANVPDDEFEAAVEAEKPATVTELAERGKKSAPPTPERDPVACNLATEARMHIRNLAEFAGRVDQAMFWDGFLPHEQKKIREHAATITRWLSFFMETT